MRVPRRTFLRDAARSIAGGAMVLLVPDILRAGMRSGPASIERAIYSMGTTVSISAIGQTREQILSATSAAFNEVYRLEKILSVFRHDSDIARMNAMAGKGPVRVHTDTRTVLSLAKEIHDRSNGSFDVTVEPLMRRWGFRPDDFHNRETTDIVLGDQHVRLLDDGSVGIDHPDVRVDLGGIAVGFAVDQIVSILRSYDVHNALINHGGDIFAMGAPTGTEGWSVIVPHPREDAPDLLTISLRDKALSTSTNVRSTRQQHGRTIGHIFDPASGENPQVCMSMSVLAPTACEADALSTACFVSGRTDMLDRSGYDHIGLFPGERLDTSIR